MGSANAANYLTNPIFCQTALSLAEMKSELFQSQVRFAEANDGHRTGYGGAAPHRALGQQQVGFVTG